MKSISLTALLLILCGCVHIQSEKNRDVANDLQKYENGFFRFGIDKGNGKIDSYSVKNCDIFVPSINPKINEKMQNELSLKGYSVHFNNELFTSGTSIYGFQSIYEKKEFHKIEQYSGSLFLRIIETKALNESQADMREAVLGVFSENGFEIAHTYWPLNNKNEFLRLSSLPNCQKIEN
jgi:hypothetical protein